MLLQVKDLSVAYGMNCVVQEVNFSVDQSKVVCIVGANGAGKSTIINTISGLIKPTKGAVIFNNKDLLGIQPHSIVRLGIVQVPEGRGIFSTLTVKENLEVAASVRLDKKNIKRDFQKLYDLFPRIRERLAQVSGTLSGGEQQMLALGRAFVAGAKLLLLDEPSMGLAPSLVEHIYETIVQIKLQGIPILLVEQNAYKAMSVADYVYVLETGRVVLEGTPAQIRGNARVKEAYLGGGFY